MKAFFNSAWQQCDTIRPVHNPFDESVIGEVPDLEPGVLDEALAGLSQGSLDLVALGREGHHAIFVRLHELLRQNARELSRQIQTEQGKPFQEATAEVDGAIQSVEVLADNPSLIGPSIHPLAPEVNARGGMGFTLRRPHGVVGILTPLVYPLLFPVLQACYALAAGNAVALKPARPTPLLALRLVELLLESGLPPGAIACITGAGDTLGSALCSDKRINYLSCLGRLPTIRAVRRAAAFVPVQLQWGCASSAIVDRLANLDKFVEIFVRSSFDNAGQSAFTPSWIAVVDEIHDELVDRLAAALGKIRLGNPLDRQTTLGPVASAVSTTRFDRILESELGLGAEIVCGGRREGRLIEPTLLRNCALGESILCQREVRGPLVGITRISKPLDAIEMLQHQRHHVLSIFSADEPEVVKEAMDLPFENIHVNGIPTWRDGLICVPGHPPRSGVRSAYDRILDFSRTRDVVCH